MPARKTETINGVHLEDGTAGGVWLYINEKCVGLINGNQIRLVTPLTAKKSTFYLDVKLGDGAKQ